MVKNMYSPGSLREARLKSHSRLKIVSSGLRHGRWSVDRPTNRSGRSAFFFAWRGNGLVRVILPSPAFLLVSGSIAGRKGRGFQRVFMSCSMYILFLY
jgi:hypothetical protein